MKEKITAVITTFNNEKKINDVLKSISWADEIIIVDGHSRDSTVDICKKYTDKIYLEPNHPQWNINKNFGFDRATSNWILNLDSDEIVTEATIKECKIKPEGATCVSRTSSSTPCSTGG